MFRRLKNVFLLSILLLLVVGCAGIIQETPPQVTILPIFSFESPNIETKKNNIVLGIIKPIHDTGFLTIPVMDSENRTNIKNTIGYFTKSMATDFEKIIIARGYRAKGPFDSLSDMAYPDKKGSDLLLSSEIFLSTSYSTTGKADFSGFFGPAKDGILTVSGFMKLMIFEPLSGEKMWIKKINFEPVSIGYKFSYYDVGKEQKIKIDTRPEKLKIALEKIYPKIMNVAWKYLHPEEILYLKKESQEIRKRKQY